LSSESPEPNCALEPPGIVTIVDFSSGKYQSKSTLAHQT
jgi:hypothetical protein